MFHIGSVGCSQHVVQENEHVAVQIKGQVGAAARDKKVCKDNKTKNKTYIGAGQVILVWLKAVTPGFGRTYLAAIKAPRIIVNTVSWTGLENFFLSKVTDGKAQKHNLPASSTK